MANGASIHVHADSKFEGECSEARVADFSSEDMKVMSVVDKTTSLLLTVKASDDMIHKYRVKPDSNLWLMVEDYRRRRAGMWKISVDGELIKSGSTAAKASPSYQAHGTLRSYFADSSQMELEDGDMLEAVYEATGGCLFVSADIP